MKKEEKKNNYPAKDFICPAPRKAKDAPAVRTTVTKGYDLRAGGKG